MIGVITGNNNHHFTEFEQIPNRYQESKADFVTAVLKWMTQTGEDPKKNSRSVRF